jgi:hypothetical protein
MASLLDPAILFFFFGVLAALVRSNLEVPGPIAKFLSLYLLLAIGFKGGVTLAETGFTRAAAASIALGLAFAAAVPAWSYAILVRRVGRFDAAAIAAAYGSVSAVTYITAVAFANRQGLEPGGHMAIVLALMETPAVVMAIVLANRARAVEPTASGAGGGASLGHVLGEAFTDGAHMMLLASIAIGAATGAAGRAALEPLIGGLFKGILLFFLLDMGLVVGRRLREARALPPFLIGFALAMPPIHAALALGAGWAAGLPAGDAYLLAVLVASASYIVVPAVVRYAIPEANPAYYFGMALAITFPLNIAAGLPLYHLWTRMLFGAAP